MFRSNADTELLASQTTSATETNADNCTLSAAGSSSDHNVQNDTETQGNTTRFKRTSQKTEEFGA